MKLHMATIPAAALKVKARSAYYTNQKRIFVLVVIAVSIAPLIAIGLTSLHYYRESWVEKTSRELLSLADSRREMIELFLANQEQLLHGLMELYPAETLIKPGMLEKVFSSVARNGVIADLGVIDGFGVHRAYVGPYSNILTGRNYAEAKWFREAVRKGRFVSDIFKGYRGEPHMVVAVTDASRKWVIRATVNSDYFNALLANAEVGSKGDAYIINREGEFQTPSRLLPTAGEDTWRDTRLYSRDPGAFHDDSFIYAISPLKDGGWALILKTSVDTSLMEFYRAKNHAMAFIAATSALIIAVSFALIGHMMRKVEEADTHRMKINNRMLEVEKMALVGRLAASVAHEINNPLQVMDDQAGWILDLLADRQPASAGNLAEYRKAADRIRLHVRRAKNITHRLLGFSRTGREVPIAADVNQLVSEAASFLESEAGRHQITVRKNLAPGLPSVLTVPSQLQQVFINIIHNAIEAIGLNGAITISTSLNGSGTVLAEFADSGPGVPDEMMKRIFDPFFSTKKSGDNAGLGLSISFNIIQRLGGAIEARNGKHGGSVFSVTLPPAQGAGI